MLTQLYVENLAVIAKADIALIPGFNVFTGETGAGKSILMNAIGAVLGQRVSKEIIRTGETRARVTAIFTHLSGAALRQLADLGYEPDEDGNVMLSRTIQKDGNSCRVNGSPATTAVLKAMAPFLMDVHGQHDNARLLSPEYHLMLIDQFGSLSAKREECRAAYERLSGIKSQLDALTLDAGEKARRIDLLEYQVDEITKASLASGEEEELEAQRMLMRNAERIASGLSEARELLNPEYGEQSGIVDLLSALSDALGGAAQFIPDLEGAAARVTEFSYELSDLGSDLAGYLEQTEYSPQQLDDIETRLSLLHSLKLKYGESVDAVIAFCESAKQELESLQGADERRAKLQQAYAAQLARTQKAADTLTLARQKAAARFVKAVEKELAYLDMPSVRLTVSQEKRTLGPTGQDSVELLISPNAGETPRPLHKIASGGEISRIMLSIKNVLTTQEDSITSIFDEVDTGVSGRAADKIGQKLAAVARGRQVLCVTHLAQVAAYADHHLLIEKTTEKGRTFTQVHPLEGGARAGELARIISGDAVTETALANAGEMLASAAEKKKAEKGEQA